MLLLLTFASEAQRDKFEVLYNKYKNLLLHKAYGILRDYSLAEDAVSEAYIRVYKNLHKVEDPESGRAAAFLVTIVKNVALTMLSAGKRLPVEEYDDALADERDLEETALSSISSQRIYQICEGLEEDLKSVFLLRYAFEYSNQEIAKLCLLTEGNVRVRLFRARKKLATLLQREGYAP